MDPSLDPAVHMVNSSGVYGIRASNRGEEGSTLPVTCTIIITSQ